MAVIHLLTLSSFFEIAKKIFRMRKNIANTLDDIQSSDLIQWISHTTDYVPCCDKAGSEIAAPELLILDPPQRQP